MRKFNLSMLVAISFLAFACGKQSVTYSTKAKQTATAAATTSTPTVLEGQWQHCDGAHNMAVYQFTGNGYAIYTDYYSSEDCSDSSYNTEQGIDSGTFQLGSATSGSATAITFTPASYTGNSSYSGSVLTLGTTIDLFIGNAAGVTLRNVNAGSGLASTDDN